MIGFFYFFSIIFSINLLILIPAHAATEHFQMLKSMLNSRNNEAKVYIPDRAVVGKELEIIVDAPKAKKITLLKANAAGSSEFEGTVVRLAEGYQVVGESLSENNNFHIKLPLKDYARLVNKDIYFDAVVEYEDEGKSFAKTAVFYGANAIYSNHNSVRVVEPKKDNAAAETAIRSFMPGLINSGAAAGY